MTPGTAGTKRALRGAVTAAMVLLVSSCARLGPEETVAGDVATQFHRAVSGGDGIAACSLLAPETVHQLEQTAGTPCDQAVLDQDLPAAQTVQDNQAFGRGAQVVMDADVLFLGLFDGRWEITAAGCQPTGDRPYDCTLKGS